ncbi:dihydrolipoamide acetyltransferase family protein [Microbacterium paludicola]|uniref:dihydrolipoamide acetyltransferase family protein n=1 Tax=Microbacterium paludicola TaxID=300019 RepID=UPI0031D42689
MSTATTQVFRLPDLGEGLTEAELVQWLVKVGDTVRVDQAIAEVETAKSVVELPSPFAGTVVALHGEPGAALTVGAPVLEVAPADPLPVAGEAAPLPVVERSEAESRPVVERSEAESKRVERPSARFARSGTANQRVETAPEAAPDPDPAPADPELEAHRAEERAGSGNVLIGYGTTAGSGARRRRPRRVPPSGSVGRMSPAGPDTRTSVTHPLSAAPQKPAVRSPLVRRLARDLGVDVAAIRPTGQDGAVTRDDVLRAAKLESSDGAAGQPATAGAHTRASASPARQTVLPMPAGLAEASRERMSMLHRAAAATYTRSRAEIPEATVWVDVDVTDLWNLRPAMAAPGERPPSFTALLARFVLLALRDHPLLAGRVDGDELVTFDGVHLGVATDTTRGLMVPVLPRADRMSVAELDGALRALADDARSGSLPPARLSGSTFTLNNYGAFGVDGSAAIINHPEVAILGVGRALERPWVVGGVMVPRRIAQLSLVFDHRVCDGGYAARFLRQVVDALESPLSLYGNL